MAAAPWNKARALLGLPPVARRSPRQSRAKAREERQRDHYGEVTERALRYIRDQQTVTMKQEELADLLATNRSTLRIVLHNLQQAGSITITTTRGRYGRTVLAYVQPGDALGTTALSTSHSLKDNVQSAPFNPGDVVCPAPPGCVIPCAERSFSPVPVVNQGTVSVAAGTMVASSGGGLRVAAGLSRPPWLVLGRRAVRLARAAGLLPCRDG